MKHFIIIFIVAFLLHDHAFGAEHNIATVKNVVVIKKYTDSAFKAQKASLDEVNMIAFIRLAFDLYPDLKPNFARHIQHRHVAESLIKFKINDEEVSNNEYKISVDAQFNVDTVRSIIDRSSFQTYASGICEDCFIVPVELHSTKNSIWNTDWFDAWHEISLKENIRLPVENLENIAKLQDPDAAKYLISKTEDPFIVTLIADNGKPIVKIERILSGQSRTIEFPTTNLSSKDEIKEIAKKTFRELLNELISVDVSLTTEYDSVQLVGFEAFFDWDAVRNNFSGIEYEFLYISEKGCIIQIPDRDFTKVKEILLAAGYSLNIAGDREWVAERAPKVK